MVQRRLSRIIGTFLVAVFGVAAPARADLPLFCLGFTDTPLVAGVIIKAVHLTQLRTCINELRTERLLAPATWTDPVITTQVTMVKAVHITELRAALSAAYVASGSPAPPFSDPPIAGQTMIAASFFTEIRTAIALTPPPPVAIVNADFEDGFSPIGGPGNPGLLANGWQPSGEPHEVLLASAGVPNDHEQEVVHGGLFQNITMVPGTTYVVTADVHVVSGSARLYLHMAGGVQEVWKDSAGTGASRLRLVYPAPASPTGAFNARVGLSVTSGSFRVDHVQVVPVGWATANERVTNGDFEAGFQTPAPIALSWARFGTSSSSMVFAQADSNTGHQQYIEQANVGDGIGQQVSVIPGQRYLLRANITGVAGAARLGIGPVGTAATHTVGWCGGGGVPHTLSMLYTPPAGQTSVTVSIAGAWAAGASFHVDEVSLMPTTLTYVYPGASQGECVQRHTVTFSVHDLQAHSPIEGALITISPAWGTGPPRTTYANGSLSYSVGEGLLQYQISKAGFVTKTALLNITGALTYPVALGPENGGSYGPITITKPLTATTYGTDAIIRATALTDDPGHTVTRVDFVLDGVVVASDMDAPYNATWTGLPLGDYSLTARSYVGNTQAAESPTVLVSVKDGFSCPAADPDDDEPDDEALQDCLDELANVDMGRRTLYLSPPDSTTNWGYRGYIVNGVNDDDDNNPTNDNGPNGRGLRLSQHGTQIKSSRSPATGQPAGPYTTATILAGRDLFGHILRTSPNQDVNNFSIEYITFEGMVDQIAPDGPYRRRRNHCEDPGERIPGREYNPGNLLFQGRGFTIAHNESKGALCGSGLGVLGSVDGGWNRATQGNNFHVVDNFIAFNGREEGLGEGTKWSDGMTILQCDGGYIAHNRLVDNTDIDLALGGGEGCLVELNTIAHVHRYGFAGLNLGKFDTYQRSGNHQGSVVRRNNIFTAPDFNTNGLLAIGLLVGSRPWPGASTLSHVGEVYENVSNGNVMNAFVSGVETGAGGPQGTFLNNSFGFVFGRNGYGECDAGGITYGVDETRVNLARLTLQGHNPGSTNGWLNMWYEGGRCEPW